MSFEAAGTEDNREAVTQDSRGRFTNTVFQPGGLLYKIDSDDNQKQKPKKKQQQEPEYPAFGREGLKLKLRKDRRSATSTCVHVAYELH